MRTFEPKQKSGHQASSANSGASVSWIAAKDPALSSISHVQRRLGNHAMQRLLQGNSGVPEVDAASATDRFGHDFSRIPVNVRETDARSDSGNWPPSLRDDLEHAFQVSLRNVPLTADPSLAQLGGAAATDGVEIRVDPRWLNAQSKGGRHLIAHELAHLTRQPHADTNSAKAEKDADALAGRFMRGQRPLLTPTVLQPQRSPMRFKTAVDAAKDTIRLATEGFGTDEDAILIALRNLTPAQLAELAADPVVVSLLQDELSGKELADVGALLARGRVGGMSRADIAAVAAEPDKHSIGVLAAARARDLLLEHNESVAATGTGTIQGNKCADPLPMGAHSADCTTYVLDVLKSAFAAKGQAATWTKVMSTANTASGADLKGTEVLKALQSEANWEGVFWAPDPRNPKDASPEHPAAYKKVREQGTYYGVAVDRSKSVIEYRRTNPAEPQDQTGIDKLRHLQFGVLATRGGMHMALIVNGSVYEIHWDKPATDPNTIEATPLESFVWESGVIVAPKGDLDRAWNTF